MIDEVVSIRRQEDYDEDAQHMLIGQLHRAGSRSVFERCLVLCESEDPIERAVACDILGQLGGKRPFPYREETIPVLAALLSDNNDIVLDAAITALGHLDADETLLANLALAKHPSPDVRFAMAWSLGGVESPRARRTLIRLSADADDDVRNWATFGLGTQTEANTKEIRAALMARADDPHDETRLEALIGLASRKVREVIPYLVRELERDPEAPYTVALQAADAIPEPELLSPLQKIMDAIGDKNGRIAATIAKIRERISVCEA